MRFARSTIVLAALAVAAAAPTADAATLKLKGGTTKLTFGPPALQALAGMGIATAPTAPATAAGPTLSFPISSGSVKTTRAGKVKSGKITHGGGMTMSNQTLTIALTKPVVVLAGKDSALNATTSFGTGALAIQMATLDLSKAKASVTAKRVKLAGVRVRLTQLAADAMNAGFSVTGFTPGFEIGTAELRADVKR